MGYWYENNGQIKNFWPDDDDNTMYLSEDITLRHLCEEIEYKWPGIDMEKLQIRSETIHTSCLTYDLYDPSDWTNFIIVERIG